MMWGLQLLENSTATVFGLAVLILLFGPVSGAHFNPVVTATDWGCSAAAPAPASPPTISPPTWWRGVAGGNQRCMAGQPDVRPAALDTSHTASSADQATTEADRYAQ